METIPELQEPHELIEKEQLVSNSHDDESYQLYSVEDSVKQELRSYRQRSSEKKQKTMEDVLADFDRVEQQEAYQSKMKNIRIPDPK